MQTLYLVLSTHCFSLSDSMDRFLFAKQTSSTFPTWNASLGVCFSVVWAAGSFGLHGLVSTDGSRPHSIAGLHPEPGCRPWEAELCRALVTLSDFWKLEATV